MTPKRARPWGYWTQAKLGVLADYLPAFLTASKGKASEFVYLDAFAGEGRGVDRITQKEFAGSVRIALEAEEAGGFTRLCFFEQERRAAELDAALRKDYPDRTFKVYPGDCNTTIPMALRDLNDVRWAPTFAFIDPDGMELRWETLEALAAHKRGYRPPGSAKPEYKVELWILFSTPGFMRTLALDAVKFKASDAERATRVFGTQAWKPIYELRRHKELSAPDARNEYLNLMRWRLAQDLGYRSTHPLELKNTQGTTVYHMVFATDNETGEKIMSDLYTRAARQIPQMQKEARDRKVGQLSFETAEDDLPLPDAPTYEYQPPWQPPSD